MRNARFVYIFVRKDIPIDRIPAQVAHAAIESALYFGEKTGQPYTVIVCEALDEQHLKTILNDLDLKTNIQYRCFIEGDFNFTMTAFATEPISFEELSFFRPYKLLSFEKPIDKSIATS